MTAKTNGKVETPAPATPGVFTLSDEQLAAVNAVPDSQKRPEFTDAVIEAFKTGDRKGIAVSGTDDEIDKARKNIGVKLLSACKRATKELELSQYEGKVAVSGKYLKAETTLVKAHPKLGSFVAFTITAHDVKVKEETPEGEQAQDAASDGATA